MNVDKKGNEHIEQEDLVGLEEREDDDEKEEGELVEGEVENEALPAGVETVQTGTWNEPDGSVRALSKDKRVVMGLIREVNGDGE